MKVNSVTIQPQGEGTVNPQNITLQADPTKQVKVEVAPNDFGIGSDIIVKFNLGGIDHPIDYPFTVSPTAATRDKDDVI